MYSLALPLTMRQLLQPDLQSTTLILTTAPIPTPTAPDDVLVRVHACAPCAGELLWAKNFPDSVPKDKVMVPCQDLAGTVVTAPESSAFKSGDRVFCRVSAERAGTAREYALAKVGELAKIPEGLGWIEAAATPLSALTAWQALFVHGGLDEEALKEDDGARQKNAGKRVLVTGASGGVGSWVVQLAALAGATVVAVCGAGKTDSVRKLGASEVVDYTKTSIEQWIARDPKTRAVDLVVDVVGGKTLAGCWMAVREGGYLISANTPPDMLKPDALEKKLTKSLFFIVEPLGSNLAEIGELVYAGKVAPVVDSVWPLDQFAQAFEKLESGHAKGKIVITIRDVDV
jgi:NADPH:quinone reductase-like Zn-dependent oxidoreductase